MNESPRLPHRRVRILRHILLASAFVVLSVIFMRFFPKRDTISCISIGTAYSALFLTGLALLLGPWNVLRRQFDPVSFDLRPDTGIWAGIAAVVHTGVGLNVHLRGRPWLYFVNEHHDLRVGMFGFGNYAGLVAALLFVMLLAISNDLSLRRLGAIKWKSLQRWTYVAVALTACHAVAYQNVEKRTLPFRLIVYAVLAAIVTLQLAGILRRKRMRG